MFWSRTQLIHMPITVAKGVRYKIEYIMYEKWKSKIKLSFFRYFHPRFPSLAFPFLHRNVWNIHSCYLLYLCFLTGSVCLSNDYVVKISKFLLWLTSTCKPISTVSRQTGTCEATWSVTTGSFRTTVSVVCCTLVHTYVITGRVMKYI